MNSLVVGGTSGLGLELARTMAAQGDNVTITGRVDPTIDFVRYRKFDLSAGKDLPSRIGHFVSALPPIDTLVYAAGYYQEGHIDDLSDREVDEMIDVGSRGLVFVTKKLLEKQDKLPELITITSTSQWVPRELEPVYNLTKAGAAHYSNGLSKDPRVGKTLVIGPSGMATPFWKDTSKDINPMMDPSWVAEQISELRKERVSYLFAKVLGANGDLPSRVEIVETRPPHEVPEEITEINDSTIPHHLGELTDMYRLYRSILEADTGEIMEVPYREEVIRDNRLKALQSLPVDADYEAFTAAIQKARVKEVPRLQHTLVENGFVGDITRLFDEIHANNAMTPTLRKQVALFRALPVEQRLRATKVRKDGYTSGGIYHSNMS